MKEETLILIVFTVLALIIVYPYLWPAKSAQLAQPASAAPMPSPEHTDYSADTVKPEFLADRYENFITDQRLSSDPVGMDPDFSGEKMLHPRGKTSDYESLIYDNTTGAIMTGSQFMENTGIIAPLWVAPAWDPDAYGPSSKGALNPSDYENDPRMLYNKCSLSCCSPQYPTPFKGDVDPFTCDANGKSKYLASDYTCQNNTGGVGCLCITEKQERGMAKGFVDYYADPKLGY